MFGSSTRGRAPALLTAGLLVLLGSPEVWGQKRVFARVEPNADEEKKLVFDINLDPSDNISPNMVLSRDAQRGFVAYAGSGTVLVFSFATGEVLKRIETGGKPSMATVLPDLRTLAVVSVLDNRVFILDMDACVLVATYSFSPALFGFGSIVTASPDGAFGYISSTGTGEVIKFRLSDGQEVGRLKGFQAPTQITLTLDGSTLMVVDALTEELVFAGAADLTRKKALKGKGVGFNFTIFNKAVLSPDGATGIIASRDFNGPLGGDTVFLFRVSDAEILETATIGAEPGFTTLTPDGKYWAILNEFSLTLINTSDFKDLRELQTVRGGPLGSANIVFSSDSRYAYYVSSSDDIVFQHDLWTSAVVGQVLVGDTPNEFLDQPSSMAISPDGSVIAVVNFLSNNIDMLTDVWTLNSAKFFSSEEVFTGLTLINYSEQEAKITVVALNNFGEAVTGEEIENPVVVTLAPNNQVTKTVAELFHFDMEERQGWLAVFSDTPDIAGYTSVGDTSLNRLDGAPFFRGPMYDFVVPEIVSAGEKNAEYNIVNPFFNQSIYNVSYILRDGTVKEERASTTAFPTNRHPQVFGEQFPPPPEEVVNDGYLRIRSGQGLILTEFFGGSNASAAVNGIDLESFGGITALYSPHFAVLPGFKTILNVINGNEEEAVVTIVLHGSDGRVIGKPLTKTVAPREQIKDDIAKLFKENPEVSNVTGWLKITSNRDRVVGTVTFTNEEETFLTSFVLAGRPFGRFLFPVVAEDSVYQTGMALLNPGDSPATVTLEVWGPEGTLDRSTSLVLPPLGRTALYLRDYFADLEARLQGHLRIRSTAPLFSFSIINDSDFNFITALPPVPLP